MAASAAATAATEPLKKHERYGAMYLPGDVFWGLGVELETYIEMSGGATTIADFLRKNQARERYSVDYWKQYRRDSLDPAIDAYIAKLPNGGETRIRIPLLLNGHSLSKTDRFGESATTYSRTPVPNPKFCGTTLLEDLGVLENEVFVEGRDRWWTLDGDTVEFMTQDFYCARMEDVCAELTWVKEEWLGALRRGLAALPDREIALRRAPEFPSRNHGFAVFLTNRNNVAIFNNGTYHINITLPTLLDKDARIANWERFVSEHRRVARLFQWITPFLIARFGSGDVLGKYSAGFPRGSQRLCASRYVGAGIFDTVEMRRGKILQVPNPFRTGDGSWYSRLYDRDDCAYERLSDLGLDINFNKHWNHGLELRIFDWFPESELPDLLRLLIWMCDEGLSMEEVPDPRESAAWNHALASAIWNGSGGAYSGEDGAEFAEVLGLPTISFRLLEGYSQIWKCWRDRWDGRGPVSQRMIRRPLLAPMWPRLRRMGERFLYESVGVESVVCEVPWRAPPPSPKNTFVLRLMIAE